MLSVRGREKITSTSATAHRPATKHSTSTRHDPAVAEISAIAASKMLSAKMRVTIAITLNPLSVARCRCLQPLNSSSPNEGRLKQIR